MSSFFRKKGNSLARLLTLFLSAIVSFSFSASTAFASSPADAWADAVYNFSGTGVTNPNNALGPADGQTTNSVGLQKFITLDMGEGEEGTESLRVYFGQLLLQTDIQVIFFDSSLNPITSQTRDIAVSTGTHSEVFTYHFADFGKAYRYVRLTSLLEAGFTLDAVEALAYNTPPPPPPPAPSNCQSDTWSCGEWSYCSSNGQETRSCSMTSDCPGVTTPGPASTRECIPPSSPSSPTYYPPSYPAPTYNAPTYYPPTYSAPTPAPNPTPAAAPSVATKDTGGSKAPTKAGSSTGDTTAPVISNILATGLDPTTEKITWQTDEPSDSGVEYGTENGIQRFTPLDPTLTKEHSVWLTGLSPNTTYVFRVYSRDAAANQTRSPESRFTTLAGQAAASLLRLDTCSQIGILLSALLLLAVALAAHWHGQAVAMRKRVQSQKKS